MTSQTATAEAILAAAHFLAENNLFGLVWFDKNLTITMRTGSISSFAEVGEPVTETVLPLFGLDENIRAMQSPPYAPLRMPNVAIITDDEIRIRLNFHIFWIPARSEYLLLIARAPAHHTMEMQLHEENRRRTLAEEKNVLQAAQLHETNAELSRANRDLSEFAYIISHDLNAPLRALRYHADDLRKSIGEQSDPAIVQLLTGITSQSQRMSAMLSDLLAYSRIDRKHETIGIVDTQALVSTVVQSLPHPKKLRIEINGTWPAIRTYTAPLDLALRNILDNAIKHHDTGTGLVSLNCTPSDNEITISIKDDGPGIEPRYHNAIFQPFCKLDPDDGNNRTLNENAVASGIGLALVRRTAEVVGARLELISNPSSRRGTEFQIFWPIIADDITQ